MKNIYVTVFLFLSFLQLGTAQLELDEVDSQMYGQGRSIGVSIFGGGLIGVPLRFVSENQNQIEIVPSLTGYAEVNDLTDEFENFSAGIAIFAGYNILLGHKVKQRKSKVRKNYLSIKGGVSLTSLKTMSLGFTWHREGFYIGEFNRSRGLDLGLFVSRAIGDDQIRTFNGDLKDSQIGLFLRFDWNWFKPSKK